MVKNDSGFSLIELLAAIVIFGILMGTAVITVSSVLNKQRNKTYTEDAIRLGSTMDYKLRSDNKMIVPANGQCIAMDLAYLDNNSFEKGPYGNEYDPYKSFVVAKRDTTQDDDDYIFYVRLLEKMDSGGYRGINLVDYNSLFQNNNKVVNLSNAEELVNFKNKEEDLKSFLSDEGVICSSVNVYVSE